MTQSKRCFVAMPIQRDGTPEHAHFKALYQQVIKPTIEARGYTVTRADEIKHGGAITRDIVLPLANADLVLVDLTDLNPNVFYELGVRHSLQAKGTVMIVDVSRTPTIPFDLGAYRVIQFKGELTGISTLVTELNSFLDAFTRGADHQDRDNPVHDWIPALPPNAMASAEGSLEGSLRDELKKTNEILRRYEKAYGAIVPGVEKRDASPLSTVMTLVSQAQDGSLPTDILNQAERASGELDAGDFLAVVRRMMERGIRLSARQFLTLASLALRLDMPDLVGAIHDYALDMHPKDREIRRVRLAHLCHATDPAARERARQDLLKESGVVVEPDGHVHVPHQFDDEAASMWAMALDGYLKDEANEQVLAMTNAMCEAFPLRSVIVRNHARALERMGRREEALDFYRRALWCPDVNDVSAVWLGNELHNRGRHTDAIEAYLRACQLDPNDSSNFLHVADDIAWALLPNEANAMRGLPAGVSVATLQQAVAAAASCGFDRGDMERLAGLAKRAELDLSEPLTVKMSRADRVRFASELYGLFQSELTLPPATTTH